MENTDETTVHRSFRVPVELDEHIQNTEEHKYLKDKYFAVLRRGLNLPPEHRTEHTQNTDKDWGEQIEALQLGMKQLHQQMRVLREENKVMKSELGIY